jgi:methylated-DNA-[protein]-cysteine S-methyltransferase
MVLTPHPLWIAILANTPVGPVTVAASERGLVRISVGFPLSTLFAKEPAPACLQAALDQIEEYFDRRRQTFDLPIDWSDTAHTAFSTRARKACMEIPYGQTRTYAQLANSLNSPNGSRAIGHAMAANPLPILIPCHRVIGTDGKLHGYAAPDGIQSKIRLLRLEGVEIPFSEDSHGSIH